MVQSSDNNALAIISSIKRRKTSITGCLALLFFISSIVLAILYAIELSEENNYTTAQCYVTSITISSISGSDDSRYYRAVYNVILYKNDGINITTAIWLPVTDNAALIVNNPSQKYQPNRIYACYYEPSHWNPGEVQFNQPSKPTAIGILCGFIICFLLSIIICCLQLYFRVLYNRKTDQQNNGNIPVNVNDMAIVSSLSGQDLFHSTIPGSSTRYPAMIGLEEEQIYVNSFSPPTYDEVMQQMDPALLKNSVDNVFNK
ncbi:unnamed protein product [Adineta steineri]|uniref:Uncharacterized protein n=1 Tax=Adineta steineri TaxID=433720 RepID=A0A814CUR3_9BILA|nr:unnamed protein product [Adineta steineri]CAF1094974.1 unnamed protein product [Adineta steineri]